MQICNQYVTRGAVKHLRRQEEEKGREEKGRGWLRIGYILVTYLGERLLGQLCQLFGPKIRNQCVTNV